MTTPENAAGINAATPKVLTGNNYVGPASNAERSGISLTARTGLPANGKFVPIEIPSAAEGAFSKPLPIGPFTMWQRLTGQRYTAKGVLNLETGSFSRTGVNWNQVQWYAIDLTIDGILIAGGGAYLAPETAAEILLGDRK
jgi:hypothetical protein